MREAFGVGHLVLGNARHVHVGESLQERVETTAIGRGMIDPPA